ncbi:MAG: HAD family phosphatase [Saprospiraceae bacterium]|nr:HAD family phosphatase [Saprospiraceae bacterium]
MQKKRISTILFDLGNVLFDLDIPATERALSTLMGDSVIPFKTWARDNQFFERFEIGEISNDLFVSEIKKHCVADTSDQSIIDAWNAMLVGMPPKRMTWLEELRSSYRIALLSNTNGLHINWVRAYFQETHALTEYEDKFFDRAYYSHDIGARKPDKQAYAVVLEDLGVRADEVFFIDDVLENTITAATMGIRVHQHIPGTEIMNHLSAYIRKA